MMQHARIRMPLRCQPLLVFVCFWLLIVHAMAVQYGILNAIPEHIQFNAEIEYRILSHRF